MASKGISVGVTAELSGLTKGMLDAKRTVEDTSQEMQRSFQRTRASGEQGIGGLIGAFKDFKREQVQQGRLVGFYAREIGEVASVGKELQGVIGGLGSTLTEAAMSGLSFGLAFEGIKLGIAAFKSLTVESDAQLKRLHDEQTDRLKRVSAAAEEARKSLVEMFAAQGGMSAKDVKPALAQAQTIADAKVAVAVLKDAIEENAKLQKDFESHRLITDPGNFFALGWNIRKAKEEAGKLQSQLISLQSELSNLERNATPFDSLRQFRGMGVNATAFVTTEEVAESDKNRERAKAIAKQAKQDANAAAKIYRETYEKDMALLAKTNSPRWFLSQYGGYGGGETSKYTPGVSAEQTGLNLYQYGGGGTKQGMGQQASAGLTSSRLKEEGAQLTKLQTQWKSYGRVAGSAISGLITGQQTLGQTFLGLARMVVDGLVQMATEWAAVKVAGLLFAKSTGVAQITSDTPVAAAEAYKAMVGVPFIGPELAAAAAAQATAFMAGQAALASASQGWDLPGGGPFPAMLHSREMVLPREQADVIRGLSASGGRVGSTQPVQVVIHAVDGRSVEDWVVKNQTAFARASSRTARTRRG